MNPNNEIAEKAHSEAMEAFDLAHSSTRRKPEDINLHLQRAMELETKAAQLTPDLKNPRRAFFYYTAATLAMQLNNIAAATVLVREGLGGEAEQSVRQNLRGMLRSLTGEVITDPAETEEVNEKRGKKKEG